MNEEEMARKQADAANSNSLLNITQGELNTTEIDDGVGGISRDHLDESMFGPDDYVLVRNIFDGQEHNGFKLPSLVYIFKYNGTDYRVQPGQEFSLPGARAYIYVKHIVSLIYRRIEKDKAYEYDLRTYKLTDPWVKEVVLRVEEVLTPEDSEKNEIQDIPSYVRDDDRLSKNVGGGEVELGTQIDDDDASNEQIDSIPDFDPKLNPKIEFDKDNKPVEGNSSTSKEETTFPGAKKPVQTKK